MLGRQLRGADAILSFEVAGERAAAAALLDALELVTPAVILGATDTLIQHPAGLTHHFVDAGARELHGISEGLLRLSVGLEDPGEIWADLTRALDAAAGEPFPRRLCAV